MVSKRTEVRQTSALLSKNLLVSFTMTFIYNRFKRFRSDRDTFYITLLISGLRKTSYFVFSKLQLKTKPEESSFSVQNLYISGDCFIYFSFISNVEHRCLIYFDNLVTQLIKQLFTLSIRYRDFYTASVIFPYSILPSLVVA